jgi:hypothetical protein
VGLQNEMVWWSEHEARKEETDDILVGTLKKINDELHNLYSPISIIRMIM